MKENSVVLKSVAKIVVFILSTFGFYVFFAGHNNLGGDFIGGLIFSLVFILMFLAFGVNRVLRSLPIDFRKLMIIGSLISVVTIPVPISFGEPFLYQTEANVTFPLLGRVCIITVTLSELGILLAVVDVVVTVMLFTNGGRS